MAKFAKGEYLDGLNNGEPIFYKDEFTQKMVSEDKFSESKAYAIGDYCIYENTLYKFTASKTAGAWNASVVETVTITSELNKLQFGETARKILFELYPSTNTVSFLFTGDNGQYTRLYFRTTGITMEITKADGTTESHLL